MSDTHQWNRCWIIPSLTCLLFSEKSAMMHIVTLSLFLLLGRNYFRLWEDDKYFTLTAYGKQCWNYMLFCHSSNFHKYECFYSQCMQKTSFKCWQIGPTKQDAIRLAAKLGARIIHWKEFCNYECEIFSFTPFLWFTKAAPFLVWTTTLRINQNIEGYCRVLVRNSGLC